MEQIVNIDGTLYSGEEAKISVFDHGFLFGDSIYETIRTYNRKPFLLDRHLKRLDNSGRMMYLGLPLADNQMEAEIQRTVQASSNPECYIRLIVTRGAGKIGLDINLSKHPTYVIIVDRLAPFPPEYYDVGVKVCIVSIRRNDQASLNPKMKTSNLLNNILAYHQAKEQGAFEGVLCNLSGYVTECTGSNIFLVKNGVLITPPSSAGLLEGVTRALTIQLAAASGIPMQEKNVTPDELIEADEAFITSTTKEIMPVHTINNTRISDFAGPTTRKLMSAYRHFVEAESR